MAIFLGSFCLIVGGGIFYEGIQEIQKQKLFSITRIICGGVMAVAAILLVVFAR